MSVMDMVNKESIPMDGFTDEQAKQARDDLSRYGKCFWSRTKDGELQVHPASEVFLALEDI